LLGLLEAGVTRDHHVRVDVGRVHGEQRIDDQDRLGVGG
jgi:hypothetical protein